MELRIFLSILFTSLAFLAVGFLAYLNPSHFGGNFKLVRAPKSFTVKHSISSNYFVIKNVKLIGLGIVIAGFLGVAFAAAYLFRPEIMLVFGYAK